MINTLLRIGSLFIVFTIFIQTSTFAQHENHSAVKSQYAGQENQPIKALTPEDIEGLKSGAGTPFNGMAKPAELNGYPGPRHVLDAYNAGEFKLSENQHTEIEALFSHMQEEAIPLGEKIITTEKKMDDAFKNNEINSAQLKTLITESADLYGELRFVHLSTHLKMMDILTEEQVELYNKMRGYTAEDPCQNIPEGHDPKMWKKHNGCD